MSEPRYPDIEGKALAAQVADLKNYIIGLQRYIRQEGDTIDRRNFSRSFLDEFMGYVDADGVAKIISDVDFSGMTNFTGALTKFFGDVDFGEEGDFKGALVRFMNTTEFKNNAFFEDFVTFIDLKTKGATVINGDNIATGTIDAELVRASKIYDGYTLSASFKDESIVFRKDGRGVGSISSGPDGSLYITAEDDVQFFSKAGDLNIVSRLNGVNIQGNPVTINGGAIVDVPVSVGGENGWWCRKWHSGRLECFGKFSFPVDFSQPSGQLYTQSSSTELPAYPDNMNFHSPPVVSMLTDDDAGAWVVTTAPGTNKRPPKVKFMRTVNNTGSGSVTVDIYAVGSTNGTP